MKLFRQGAREVQHITGWLDPDILDNHFAESAEDAGELDGLPAYCACCGCVKRYCQCTTCSCGCGKP